MSGTADFTRGEDKVSSLLLKGNTSSPFKIPNTDFQLGTLSMDGLFTLGGGGGSTKIESLKLEGAAALAGIGQATGVFAYENQALGFTLVLKPEFPEPTFKKVRASPMT